MAQLSLHSGYKVVKLHGRQYSIPECFKLLPDYDADNDRALVFRSQNDLALEVMSSIASDLSDGSCQFSALDCRHLVAMMSSSVLSDMVSELVTAPLEWFRLRKPDTRKTYCLSGSSSIIYNSDKIEIPDGYLFEEAKWLEVLENCEEVIPSMVKAVVIFEQLSALDDLAVLRAKCKNYILQETTKLVVLIADVKSTKHKTKFDFLQYFFPVAPKDGRDTIGVDNYIDYCPVFLDLSSVIPNCKFSLAFTANRFSHGLKHCLKTVKERIDMLCDAITKGNKAKVEKLISRISNLNNTGDIGRVPLVVACAIGDKAIIELLLQEGADKDFQDAFGMFPYLEAVKHRLPFSLIENLSSAPALLSITDTADNVLQAMDFMDENKKQIVKKHVRQLKRVLEQILSDSDDDNPSHLQRSTTT